MSASLQNDLISHNQAGFKPKDSCINQLLSIKHEIYKTFDEGYETSGVFPDILKAFDKFWHKNILHKLNENSISCDSIIYQILKYCGILLILTKAKSYSK